MGNGKDYKKYLGEECVACGRTNSMLDVAHVYTQGAWPQHRNKEWNCPTLCRMCHWDQEGRTVRFASEYPRYKQWLLDHGWEYEESINKWRYYEQNKSN